VAPHGGHILDFEVRTLNQGEEALRRRRYPHQPGTTASRSLPKTVLSPATPAGQRSRAKPAIPTAEP